MIQSGTDYADQVFKDIQLKGARLDSNQFQNCKFDRCAFVETVFQKCEFVNCIFQDCDLSMMQVPDSTFTATHFENSKIMGVNWTVARWPTIRLIDPISFSKCTINHSTFIGLDLKRLQIKHCVALNVDFRETVLSQADFSGTDLTNSLFLTTDLTEADLSSATNYQIDARQNTIQNARFSLPEAMSLLHGLDIELVEE
jgi:uncharacterized protein YjbI with pentapeptide repeats